MAIGTDKAREELERWAGKQFSREVVNAFLMALDRESISVS
jgi:HD-GYP domain-containing protein (c-di-GMP phosphodiesterase class II)